MKRRVCWLAEIKQTERRIVQEKFGHLLRPGT
jgi:hypothetical protein